MFHLLSLILNVALGAHFRHRRKVEKMFIFRPMRPVAACAIQGKVFISRVNDLFSDGVGRVLLPVMAGAAQLDKRRLLQEEDLVGPMRVVADRAVPLLYRNMFCL